MSIISNYKKPIGIGGVLVVAFVFMGLFRSKNTAKVIDPENQILTVGQVAPNPDKFKGIIRIKGTVSNVYPDNAVFAIMELSKFAELDKAADKQKSACDSKKGGGGCGTTQIPIKYDGPLPLVQADVLIEGKIITHESGRKYIQAEKITKL